MKKMIFLIIAFVSEQIVQAAWQPATKPTAQPSSGVTIGSQRAPAAPAAPSTSSFASSLAQAALSALTGGGSKPQSTWDLNFNFDVTNQEMDQTCYGELNNSVTNLNKGETMIVSGSCASSGSSSKLGKIGDITIIPLNQLTSVGNFGTVSALKTAPFTIPRISTDNGWNNALYFTFKPSNPSVSANLSKRAITSTQLADREAQIVIRTRELTQQLAQAERQTYQPGKILLEVWARTYPSVTGSQEFKQVFNIVLSANDVGKKMIFGADQAANSGIVFRFNDNQGQPTEMASTFNVITENP